MNKVNILKRNDPGYPTSLKEMKSAPRQLYWKGADPSSWLDKPKVAIVGSRKATSYGLDVTRSLASELAKAGVVIISGLALGIDAQAHKGALEGNGITAAVLPTSLENIYPASHMGLARQITERGGALISEYDERAAVFKTNFVARNRIVAGLADVLLITEAAVKSGSLHTARFALEQGKTVMAVPGNINNLSSEGCNNLIKSGAVPVTSADDVFFALNLRPAKQKMTAEFDGTKQERLVYELIGQGVSSQEELALRAGVDGSGIGAILTMLELSGFIRPAGGGNWTLN